MVVQRFWQPTDQELNRFGLIAAFVNGVRWPAKREAAAVGLAIEDAGVSSVFLHLPRSLGQRFGWCSGQFVFPADENAFREQVAHLGDHLRRRFEADGQRAGAARDFGRVAASPLIVFHTLHFVVAQRGDVKDGRDFVSRAGLRQQCEQVVVRIEQAQMTLLARTGMRRTASLEAKDFKASAGQLIAQMNTKLAG